RLDKPFYVWKRCHSDRMSIEIHREGSSLRRVGLGLAGLGRLGRRPAENVGGRVPSAQLARIVDADEAVARTTGERLGVPWSTAYEGLLRDPDVGGGGLGRPPARRGP